MAKIDQLQEMAAAHLEPGETTIAVVLGYYAAKILGSEGSRQGIFIATENRVLFFAKKFGGYDLESFPYRNISSFDQSKGPLGYKISFFASGNHVSMRSIHDAAAMDSFTTVVKGKLSAPNTAVAAAPALPEGAGVGNEIFEQLHKLGALRDAGIVTAEEFESTKAELLSRL
jgi:hypothetical protein